MRGVAGYGGNFAPYPANGYPAIDFMGAGGMSPRTNTLNASAGVVGTGGAQVSGASGTALGHLLPSSIAKSAPLSIIAVVAIGYFIWHVSSRV